MTVKLVSMVLLQGVTEVCQCDSGVGCECEVGQCDTGVGCDCEFGQCDNGVGCD